MADNVQIREVSGVGVYAVPPSDDWQTIESFIRENKLGFAPNRHALFDAIVADLFPTLGKHDLTGAMNAHLRTNLASVRNHLFVHYFEEAPEGLTPEKTRENLRFIARFIGEGLQWDEDMRTGKPADPFKTEIHLDQASATGGAGAHYLYRKIREMNRHSNWVKPFANVLEKMSTMGKDDLTSLLEETPFAPIGQTDEERYREKQEEAAEDLDRLGDQLIQGAAKLGSISQLTEPVRREAIDLAKDILNKLKISFGELNILEGLNINPDDTTTMGSVSGVMAMFDRLLAYARSIDPAILAHPAIMSAIQAFGQIGYLCKEEAMRLATSSKNTKMAERIADQLKRIPNQFAALNDKRFGALTDRVNKGIDTVLEKTQAISGPSALVGHSISQNISSFMTAAPTAGMANKQSLSQTTQRTLASQHAEESAERAQAARLMQAANAAAQRSNRDQQNAQNQRASNARQARQNAQRSLRQSQMAQNQRIMAGHAHEHDHDHHHSTQPIKPPQPTAADIAKQIDPRILMGFQNATNTSQIKTGAVGPKNAKDTIAASIYGNSGGLKPPATPPLMPGTTAKGSMGQPNPADGKTDSTKISEEQKKKQIDAEMLQPPPPPPNRGGGRGI